MAGGLNNLLRSALRTNLVVQQVRFYPRWSHRRPVKVHTPEEYEKLEKKSQSKGGAETVFDKYGGLKTTWNKPKEEEEGTDKPIKYKIKSKKVGKSLVATYQKSEVKSNPDMLETVIDGEGNFVYSKMKDNDQRVGTILTEIKSNKEKDKKDLILLEGKRLIRDALQSGCHLKYILFSRKSEVDFVKPFLPKVGAQLYKMPYREIQMWSELTTTPGIMGIFKKPDVDSFRPPEALPFTVICDNIREPGNLGTILRICAAVGCDRVILTKGCVNLWDSKVLRGAVGAHFKLRISKDFEWDQIEEAIAEDANFFIADNKIVSDSDEGGRDLAEVLEQIPVFPYHGLDFNASKHVVLIVGGETHGVSRSSYELALKSNGARVNIPLSNDVDSLNVGAALGVIAFEVKKQLVDRSTCG
ncbi:rRNA methyltransferase 3, mitochondrial [Tenebrio molitor]|uniref:rRNA methyltransferase 3, mitochondrial n=1 Tax=Tenebrio molitor TaxID=7067 RepID=UPI003624A3C9